MTKRLILILFLYLIHNSSFSQSSNAELPQFNYHRDFSNILLSTQNEDSENFYTRLLNRFLATDPTMTNAHTLALMIGFTEKPAFKPLENMIAEKEIVELVQNGNFRVAVDLSKKLLKTNPLNLMALQQITIAYNNLKIKDSAKYYMKLHIKIMDAMIYSGNGKSPETAIFSLGLADGEYFTKNVGYDIIDKDADWNRRGDFMEIIKASDQEAVNRMFYFVIQHAKLKMDDDKANSDAFNKKLKDSLDKKQKEDKKLAKSKSKIKNKISSDSLQQNLNDSTQTNIGLQDSTHSVSDSNSITKNTGKSKIEKQSSKERNELKKEKNNKETKIKKLSQSINIEDSGFIAKNDTDNIVNAEPDKPNQKKKSKKEKKNAVVSKNKLDTTANIADPLIDSNNKATISIADSIKNGDHVFADTSIDNKNIENPLLADSVTINNLSKDTSNIFIQQIAPALNTPPTYSSDNTIESTLNKTLNNKLSVIDSSNIKSTPENAAGKISQPTQVNLDSLKNISIVIDTNSNSFENEIPLIIDSNINNRQRDSFHNEIAQTTNAINDKVKSSFIAIDTTNHDILNNNTTALDSSIINIKHDISSKKINESANANNDSIKSAFNIIDSTKRSVEINLNERVDSVIIDVKKDSFDDILIQSKQSIIDSAKTSPIAIDANTNNIQNNISDSIDSIINKSNPDSTIEKISENKQGNIDSVNIPPISIDTITNSFQQINRSIVDSSNQNEAIQLLEKEKNNILIKNTTDSIFQVNTEVSHADHDSIKNQILADTTNTSNTSDINAQPAREENPIKNNGSSESEPADNNTKKNRY